MDAVETGVDETASIEMVAVVVAAMEWAECAAAQQQAVGNDGNSMAFPDDAAAAAELDYQTQNWKISAVVAADAQHFEHYLRRCDWEGAVVAAVSAWMWRWMALDTKVAYPDYSHLEQLELDLERAVETTMAYAADASDTWNAAIPSAHEWVLSVLVPMTTLPEQLHH